MNINIEGKLKEIKIENIVLVIYIILIILYYYGNQIELQYLKYQNQYDKERYRTILYIVFGTVFVISLLYSIASLRTLEEKTNEEHYELEQLSAVANLLALSAIVIYLYIIYKDKDINLEVTI